MVQQRGESGHPDHLKTSGRPTEPRATVASEPTEAMGAAGATGAVLSEKAAHPEGGASAASAGSADSAGAARSTDDDPDSMPTFSEQLADQLGGVRGLTEASIPVVAFVLVNIIWSLSPALLVSVGTAMLISAWRLLRNQSIRHALNGLFGVAVGAFIAWRTGDAADYYLPGILTALLYGAVLLVSVLVRRPVLGYVWAVIAAGGRHGWLREPGLVRVFGWVTALWAAVFFARGVVQGALYLADSEHLLGIARLAMGVPLYLAALGITVWAVRRTTHDSDPGTVGAVSASTAVAGDRPRDTR